MAGVKALRKLQLGLESSKGTAVAATAMWRGTGSLKDNREVVLPDENIGYLGQYDRSYSPVTETELTLDETPATFEQLPYPLSAGVTDTVTGVADAGTSNGKIYAYTMATTAAPTVKAYTFEYGDNQQAEETEYCFARQIKLSGAPKQAVMMSSTWAGRQITKTTFTSLSPVAVEEILFQKGKIYRDAVGGTLGNTQLTSTWLGFDMTIETGLQPVYTGDGVLYFKFDKCVRPGVTGSFTFEHDATGVAVKDDFVAGTTMKYRLAFTGSALTGSGGAYSAKTLYLDFCAKITSVDPLGDVDGNDVVKVNWTAVYNATATLFFVATVVNTLAALT